MHNMRQLIRTAFDHSTTDKGYYHEYEHMYANIFSSFEPKSILEIGVKEGKSLHSWHLLFPEAKLTGLDIAQNTLKFDSFEYVIGDSTDKDVTDKLGFYDVIIDDGSHNLYDQIMTFTNLKNKFKYFYVIEDISLVGSKGNPHPGYMDSANALKTCIRKCGYKGIALFDSFNKRHPSCSLVIQSNEF